MAQAVISIKGKKFEIRVPHAETEDQLWDCVADENATCNGKPLKDVVFDWFVDGATLDEVIEFDPFERGDDD